jgi:hypothetical protein
VTVAFGIQGSGQQVGRTVPDLGRLSELAQAAEELGVDAGAQHVVFNIAEPEDVERLAEVVLAAAR